MLRKFAGLLAAVAYLLASTHAMAADTAVYDTIIRGGMVIDGTGAAPRRADVAIKGDRIVKIGDLSGARGETEIDATGKVVTPGFINMLSWAVGSLVHDGRGLSDLVQGVTLEVFGEGTSMGPYTPESKKLEQAEINTQPQPLTIEWDTLGGYLEYLEHKGVSPNVASFVGAGTLRKNAVGLTDREPTSDELAQMLAETKQAMEEGAMGVGGSLIYAPDFYAKTEELIAIATVVSQYGGMYISHMRNEGNQFLQAFDETLRIARETGVAAEVYHLKAAGQNNWPKMAEFFEKLEAANAEGLKITADMYTYPAGATGLNAAMPPWVQAGGFDAWVERLKDPEIRARVVKEMENPTDAWDNLGLAAGPDGMLFSNFRNPDLKKYIGKTLADVAADWGSSPADTIIDLVIKNGSPVGTTYFLMSEDNMRKQIVQPWLSFGSDAQTFDPVVAKKFGSTHPRAYGNFARVLAKYVRDENLMPLEFAVHKLSGLPATNLKLKQRGFLKEGFYADVLVFDPAAVQDHATFADPHQLSTGMSHVFVNGGHVIKGGAHTGATPGRVVRGPGWTGWQ